MKRKIVQITFLILLFAIAYLRISNDRNKPIKETRLALGTFVTIDIHDKNHNNKAIIDSAFALIERYENQLSVFKDSSEISKINISDEKKLKVSDEVSYLLEKSKQISELSGGAFDITISSISKEYDFVNQKMPDSEKIAKKIKLVNYRKLDLKGNELTKENKDIHIDLGGIAKGFIVDKVIEYLRSQGISKAAVNTGGDLFVMENEKSCGWKIGIQHPRKEGEVFGEVCLKNMAIVTSGDYERYFIKNGKRIHHILDPKTGLPANKLISTTIIASDATSADALCTAIFVMGPQTGISLINSLENVEALIIYEKDGKLQCELSNDFSRYDFHRSE
jgi:thiamine biosynthesis lipoprotein